MAETLTVNTDPDTLTTVESNEGLTPEEQDSLEVGSKLIQEQEQLLAGKYKNTEDLEAAYVALQKKLGESKSEKVDNDEISTIKKSEPTSNILDTLWQDASNGKEHSKETLEQLKNTNPSDLVKLHLDYRQSQETQAAEPKTFSKEQVDQLKEVAGGDQEYNSMLKWAQANLNEQEVSMFDQAIESGDPISAFFAVKSLSYRYNDQTGSDGELTVGRKATTTTTGYRSQAELVEAMSDPRYENDPAYRRDVTRKLELSNMQF
tara:strand:- start:587 stop:1372 length:786 start_codon:yes stop_codon:yes gene_type:complete